ncbi:Serine/threonine protein kinase (plasmid) [Acidisarcina polymorpha]|uniref:Serine/threonine protein kinase n=1 Tax=Acidisarcina polymorpha TaxID=2211140 RepID=A0A2Z5GB66_9BACT|nr:PD40 domain-containing protein [Acidisarcina polymorpha]AXC16239.1 Serine/threonine protein kinase [Acidisarcina polymorpha]
MAWSPDGAWMYFSSDAGGHFHIWRQRFANGKPEQVTFGATEEEGMAMASDGRSFITSVGLVQSTIMLHDSKGDRQLSSASHAANPRFSSDGQSIFYLVPLHGASGHLTDLESGELFRVSLETGENQHLLPGILMGGYALFPDGKRVVFSATDRAGHSHLWIADIELGSPPRQFPSTVNEDTPNVDQNGNIYFRAAEGGSNFLYRMKEDGSDRVRVLPYPIIGSHGLSPDGHWAVVGRASPANAAAPDLAAVPLDGGTPVIICHNRCDAVWGDQGKVLAILLYVKGTGKTVLFQVDAANGVPSLSSEGVDSTDHPETLRGAKVLDKLIVPGPNSGQYAFLNETVRRNLYRIPLH